MAKKAVATLHEGSTDGRAYTKVIKMVKSPKTGAYMFDEKMVPNEAVQDFFKKQSDLLEIISSEGCNTSCSLLVYIEHRKASMTGASFVPNNLQQK